MSECLRRWIAVFVALCITRASLAAITLPAIFSDHAVLQADMPIPVWGHAKPGAKITVTLADQTATATADDGGAWRAALRAIPATNKPARLTITAADEEAKTIDDVLVGEVWLGSGQSNMALSVAHADKAEEFIASADKPEMRLFQVGRNPSTAPADDVNGKWVICSPKTVGAFSAVLYQFGRNLQDELHVPVGLIHSSWGGTPIQAWTPAEAVRPSTRPSVNPNGKTPQSYQPSKLFNGMISPIIPYAVRGATWYQGENNVHNGDQAEYSENMQRMVGAWRAQWREGNFAFLYVQLAPFGKYRNTPTALPEMWEQQARALRMIPNSGMAATGDLGNIEDIHPKNKHEVGRRLALIALARVYGMHDTIFEPPIYKSHEIEGDKIRVHFTGVGSGLTSRDGKGLTNFEIAGDDGTFVPAEAKIDGNDVVVSSSKVERPVALRFAWDQSAEPNLANKEGLPAIAFRIPAP